MIFTEFFAAPTVPSEPSPKNTAEMCSLATWKSVSGASDRWVTSSLMPTVNRGLGFGFANSSKTAFASCGVNSLDESP